MRNVKLGLFTILCILTAGIGISTAFEIQVGPQDYYGTLTLNRINIMKNNSITGIVLDGTGYSIKIGQGSPTDTGFIRVRQICDRTGQNCKLVSEISTGSVDVINTNQTLRWGNAIAVATVAGQEIKVTLPSNPNIRNPNTSGQAGYVAAGNGYPRKVRKTDNNGTPSRQDDANTRNANTSGQAGYVSAGNGYGNKVRKTDANGNPARRDDATGSAGDSLRQTSGTNFIIPKNSSYNVAIGDIQIKTGDNGGCSNNQLIPGIIYTDKFFIRSSNYGGGCGIASKPIIIDSSGHVAINASINESYATVIGGTTEINGSVTVEGEILGTSTLNTPSAVHNTSATINGNKFQNGRVGIQKAPVSGEVLQINGGIEVSNHYNPVINSSCAREGAIEYYNGYFYGCAKEGSTSAVRMKIDLYKQESQPGQQGNGI